VHGGDSGKEVQTIRAGVIKCIQYLSAWLALQSRELAGLAATASPANWRCSHLRCVVVSAALLKRLRTFA
jgi:hypothetical protein